MKIIIGNDHAGYALKLKIIEYLAERPNVDVIDAGTHSEERAAYPPYAEAVAGAVASGEADRGILVCSTGLGMSIFANRHKGIRATLCTSAFTGKMARAHNDSNVLCLGGRVTGYLEALDILAAWLDTAYEGGRHEASLDMLRSLDENANVNDAK